MFSTVASGTTEFVEKGSESVVFSTCDAERERVVFQMGTSDAVRALKAAEIVYSSSILILSTKVSCLYMHFERINVFFVVSSSLGAMMLQLLILIWVAPRLSLFKEEWVLLC